MSQQFLPPLPIIPKSEKRKFTVYGTPQSKRLDFRDRDWDRERDRDFELMPPPGSHKKDFTAPMDVDQPIDPNEAYLLCLSSGCASVFTIAIANSTLLLAKEVNGSTTRVLDLRQRQDLKESGIVQPADCFLNLNDPTYCMT
ncbi:hypothetical protein Patl1_22949 [Pistacia atlantica]|uniref:Uncharacterized protein n=1 Tax=Pistacia atlantica TaxID=434234 RepID=A0ACC0ZYP3_9ROSI|nr:hypothetical protein Patl1_22949 [Pistacia atlantica]